MKHYRVHASQGSALDWTQACVLTDFTFPWDDREPPATEFRALWDEERLHFRFDCVDHDFVLDTSATLRERVIGSDRVEVFLSPGLELDPYFCLEMDPRGEVLAYRCRTYRQFDWEWQCPGIDLAATMAGSTYVVVGSVPLATLRSLHVLRAGSCEFFTGVYRAEFSHQPDGSIHAGWLTWCSPGTPTPDFHVPGSFGKFELVDFTG